MASWKQRGPKSFEVHYNVTIQGIKKARTKNFPTEDEAEAFAEVMTLREKTEQKEKKLLETMGFLAEPARQPVPDLIPEEDAPSPALTDLIKTRLNASDVPLNTLLDKYVEQYGVIVWTPGTMDEKMGYIRNYISPLFGQLHLPTFTPLRCQEIISELKVAKQVQKKDKCLTPRTIEEIHKLLKNAFNKGKLWQLIADENPWNGLTLPEYEPMEKPVWTREQFAYFNKRMLQYIEVNPEEEYEILSFIVCLHFDMCCNARIGEATGLEWQNAIVSEKSILEGTARIKLEQQLTRESIKSLERTNYKGVRKVFPGKIATRGPRKSCLVLKDLKTKESRREVFLTETTARLVLRLKELQKERRSVLGAEYKNNGLVICLNDGSPCDARVIQRLIDKFCPELGLPRVTTHLFRKTGTNATLELTNGDIKTAQQKNGHATHHMTIKTYSTMQVERQQKAAQALEAVIFQGEQPNGNTSAAIDLQSITAAVAYLQSNPELLKSLFTQKQEVV